MSKILSRKHGTIGLIFIISENMNDPNIFDIVRDNINLAY